MDDITFTLYKLNSSDKKWKRIKGYSIESLLARTGKLFRMLYINFNHYNIIIA